MTTISNHGIGCISFPDYMGQKYSDSHFQLILDVGDGFRFTHNFLVIAANCS